MHAALGLFALVGFVAANPAILLRTNDDGQWHPELDGSIAGSGALSWGPEDGSWKPDLDGSWLGRGDLAWINRRKRDISNTFPADEPIVAYAKNAQLRQQQTEAARNIQGGGIPIDLPADTPEVAAGKRAHAVAHEKEKLATGVVSRFNSPVTHVTTQITTPVVARVVTPVAHVATPVARFVTPVAHVATSVTHVATPVARFVSPVAHIGTPVATHVVSPVTHIAAARTIAHVASPVGIAYAPQHIASYTPVSHVIY